jgi:CPA1 family monovalent cation:H+ antiporter
MQGMWQAPFLIGFVGVRGVVSLAAALALPIYTSAGAPCPSRDLILVVTFGVIVLTLIGEGLLLPRLVRWLRLGEGAAQERDLEQAQELQARTETLEAARRRLQAMAEQRNLPPEMLQFARTRHDEREQLIPSDLGQGLALQRAGAELRREAIAEERRVLHQLLRDGKLTDEARRELERELDLEEAILGARTLKE